MKNHILLLKYLSLFFGLIIILTMLMPMLKTDDLSFLGTEITFGKEIINVDPFNLGTIASAWLPFSWIALATFTLPVISSILMVINHKYAPISLLLALISLLLMVSLPNSINMNYMIGNTENVSNVVWEMAYGLIIAMISTSLMMISHFYIFATTNSLKLKT